MDTWEDRINQYVDRKGPDECWEWKGHRGNAGYGVAYCQGLQLRAHRVAYMVAKGDVPEGVLVLHTCDNPPCCNPAHLRLGTYLDNNEDAINKGRHRLKSARRTEAEIKREVRERLLAAATQQTLTLSTGQAAQIAGVSAQTVVNWIGAGRLAAKRIGTGPRRILKDDLIQFLRESGFEVEVPEVPA